MTETDQAGKGRSLRFWRILLLSAPLWAPVVYIPLAALEYSLFRGGPLNSFAVQLIFVIPALGVLAILASDMSLSEKLLTAPIYYVLALVVLGICGLVTYVGWCQLFEY